MKYYLAPDFCIAKIPKSYSCSIAAAMAKKYYPEIYERLHLTPALCRDVVPQSEIPEGTVYAIMREPAERFISTCAMFGLTIDEGLASDDEHFAEQHKFITDETIVFAGLEGLEVRAGINLPIVNAGLNIKPVPSDEQLAKIRKQYKIDIELFEAAKNV